MYYLPTNSRPIPCQDPKKWVRRSSGCRYFPSEVSQVKEAVIVGELIVLSRKPLASSSRRSGQPGGKARVLILCLSHFLENDIFLALGCLQFCTPGTIEQHLVIFWLPVRDRAVDCLTIRGKDVTLEMGERLNVSR